MEIIAFTGASGTGKSHRAIIVAHEHNAEVIIDDGLIIKNGRILAGISAKRQPTRIGAIKAALFTDEDKRIEAKRVIGDISPKKVLILATSEEMAKKIAARLDLPAISKLIKIEDVSSPKDINKARRHRRQFSRHVIPAPTMEVRKKLSETIIEPVQVFLRRKEVHGKRHWQEQSVVRPTFTLYGRLTIAPSALVAIVGHAVKEIPGLKNTGKIYVLREEDGVTIGLTPTFVYGYDFNQIASAIQSAIQTEVEYMTGLYVKSVNVFVKDVTK